MAQGTGDTTSAEGPSVGYFGTERVLSGRGIKIPRLLIEEDLVSVGDEFIWAIDDDDCPVFATERSYLDSTWKPVGEQTVRQDHDDPVIQIPARYFADFVGNPQLPEPLRPGPVHEPARVSDYSRLHFIRARNNPGTYVRLLTWGDLVELPPAEVDSLFSHLEQRMEFMDNLTFDDFDAYQADVFAFLNRLF